LLNNFVGEKMKFQSCALPLLLISATASTSLAFTSTSSSFALHRTAASGSARAPAVVALNSRRTRDHGEDEDDGAVTRPTGGWTLPDLSLPSFDAEEMLRRAGKASACALLALTLSFNAMQTPLSSMPAQAADSEKILGCLLKSCKLPLAKCIVNPNCLANVICINTCNGKADETGCQIQCGDQFENTVVGEFNACAVSNMNCVPQKPDDGSYPVPAADKLVKKFDTSLWNGRWYITAGQNDLFDVFPCQVHFFTETAPGKFFGKLNWRIQEPDGEFFNRDAIQEFTQDPKNPGHMINHDNEYLHYEDDWYIVDYEADGNKDGIPPFAFVYYRGSNDAWVGYGGAVVYTRDAKLPESLRPRLQEAAKKVNNWNFDKDFKVVDNTCRSMEKGEGLLLKEQFAGKMAIQTEKQLQQQAAIASRNAANSIKAKEIYLNDELTQAEKAVQILEKKALEFENEFVKDVVKVENEIVKDVIKVENEIVKDVVSVENEIVKDVVNVEKILVDDVVKVEKSILGGKKGD